eukprot:gene10978-17554_t
MARRRRQGGDGKAATARRRRQGGDGKTATARRRRQGGDGKAATARRPRQAAAAAATTHIDDGAILATALPRLPIRFLMPQAVDLRANAHPASPEDARSSGIQPSAD